LTVAISGLYVHIREKCYLTSKQAINYTIEKDTSRTLNLRYEKNCVFIDETSFYSQRMRGRTWSK
ncbi:MAG: hypothetical protein EXX96DRAFT_461063, partial [Benjaminiella poitrasii]